MYALKRVCEVTAYDWFNKQVILVLILVEWVGSIMKPYGGTLFANGVSAWYQIEDKLATIFAAEKNYFNLNKVEIIWFESSPKKF